MKIVMYTALFGEKDRLWSASPITSVGMDLIVFTEKERREVGLWSSGGILRRSGNMRAQGSTWQQQVVEQPFSSGRKSARYFKLKSHELFPKADVVIWVDANIRLKVKGRLVAKWVGKKGFAAFRHPDRRCVFQEIASCQEYAKGNYDKLEAQWRRYAREGMPRNWGLASTRCIIRRHTEEVIALNEAWWAELQASSVRDQVSLPYVCWKRGFKWAEIPGGGGTTNKHFWFIMHGREP